MHLVFKEKTLTNCDPVVNQILPEEANIVTHSQLVSLKHSHEFKPHFDNGGLKVVDGDKLGRHGRYDFRAYPEADAIAFIELCLDANILEQIYRNETRKPVQQAIVEQMKNLNKTLTFGAFNYV